MPNIEVSQDLYNRFAKRAATKGYASTDAYLMWALRQLADKIESAEPAAAPHTYTAKEEDTVRDRLRSLGYID